MLRVLLVVLASCGGSRPPTAAPAAPAAPRVAPPSACPTPDYSKVPATASLYGAVCDDHGEMIESASVVVMSSAMTATLIVLTNERGVFWLDHLPRGTYHLTTHDGDCTRKADVVVADRPGVLVQRLAAHCAE